MLPSIAPIAVMPVAPPAIHDQAASPSITLHCRSDDLAPGVVLTSFNLGAPSDPIEAWSITVAPGRARVLPVAASELPGGRADGRLAPVDQMASASGAIAAVNGGFFSPRDRIPVGLLEIQGQVLAGPLFGRAAIALSGGRPRIDRIALEPWVELPDGESAEVDFLNFPQQADALMLYTSAWGDRSRTWTRKESFEVAVTQGGEIVGAGAADLGIPPGGFVLAGTGAQGRWLESRLHRGDDVVLHASLPDYWGDRPDVMGGGPILVRDGVAGVEDERFPADIMQGRNARTAIGIEPDGTILLVAVAGDDPRSSVGMTLAELADFMAALGAQDAMNLDGGSSTTLWAAGRTLNVDTDERRVADALVVVPTPATR